MWTFMVSLSAPVLLHAHYFVLSVFVMLASTEIVSIVISISTNKKPKCILQTPSALS